MRRLATLVGDPKIQECYREMFYVQQRQTVKLILVVILMSNIQGIFGVTVGNGNVFTGDVTANRPQGNGTYSKANGIKYTGYFEDGMMKGQFLVEDPSGNIYRGDVDEDGIIEGKGVYTWPSGSRYEGEWRGGVHHGWGVKTWASGDKYEGEWRGGVRHGLGVYTWSDGSRYEGEWRGGIKHGQGVITRGHQSKWSGDRYEGEWGDDVKAGQGVYYYFTSGDKYVGEWRDDVKAGQGVYTWPNGGRYEGEYRDDVKHGQGVYTWPDGEKYVGEFKQDNFNGWGRYTYKNHKSFVEYDGEWIDDDRTGYGKMVYKDESIYNGQWSSKKRKGQGLLLWPNGTCFYGQMKNDVISHGMTMTPDLVFTFPPYKNTTYNGKGFKVVNFTGGEIECYNEDGFKSCYNNPNDIETLYFSSPKHYYVGDTTTVRRRKIMDGFGELGLDGGYYIGEIKQEIQTGFGLKTEPFLPTIIGKFENGVLEGLGASISFSSKHRFIYVGGYMKGQPFGPGMFIYPDGEKVLGYFIEGKLDHSKNPIYLHPDGTRDSLVPTSG